MNRRLAEAVIATLQEAAEEIHYGRLKTFEHRDWLVSYDWLDASGLALYFLARLKSLQIEDSLPVEVLRRLNKNFADNRTRTADMFAEFIRINTEFQHAGLSYVNIKGFSLMPDACPDAALRCQLDLDFLMMDRDSQQCMKVLEERGYLLTSASNNVWEFKAGAGSLPSVHDLYKAKPQRSLEVHFVSSGQGLPDATGDRLLGARMQTWNGFAFPVLSERDKFLTQAHHIFKHLLGEWTRASWIFEFTTYVHSRWEDEVLWRDVHKKMSLVPETKIAVGAAVLMSKRAFGGSAPALLESAARDLPEPVRLWIELYKRDVLLAKFPGTKLYLLLQKTLSKNREVWVDQRRSKLFPLHRPPSVVHVVKEDGWLQRLVGVVSQSRYVWHRLCFHVRQGLRYLIETGRWKRVLAASR